MMKLVRSPDAPEAAAYAATEKRYSVVLRADVVASDISTRVSARVINISAGGLMLVAPEGVALSGHVALTIRHLGHLVGRVVWAKNNCFGVKFDEAVDPEMLITERAERASAAARTTGGFVKKSSDLFAEREEEDVMPFIAMMRSKSASDEPRAAA